MTSWLLHSFLAVSLLILLVFALRRPVARLFGAGWAYSLWLIPALRLVLPPLPLPAADLPPSAAVLIPAAADLAAPPAQVASKKGTHCPGPAEAGGDAVASTAAGMNAAAERGRSCAGQGTGGRTRRSAGISHSE